MGYSTDFTGGIEVVPPAPVELVAEVLEFSEERHGGNTEPFAGFPGYWCDFELTEDGKYLVWNGNEKTYDAPEWVQYLIDKFLKPDGYVCNGVLEAFGESAGDVWAVVVEDNVVKERQARLVWDD